MIDPLTTPTPAVMREVNDMLWDTFDRDGYDGQIAFFCECTNARCFQAVWLTASDYASARRTPQWAAVAQKHAA